MKRNVWLTVLLAAMVWGGVLQVDPASAAAGAAVPPAPPVAAGRPGFVPGSSRELIDKRTEFTALFANPDGSKTVRSSSAPLHFKTGKDGWEPIDTAVVADGAPGVLRTKANAWTARFRPLPVGVEIETAEGPLSFSPLGAAVVVPQVSGDGSTVVYPEAWPGVDLRYQVTPTEVKEDLILKRRPVTELFEFSTGGAELDATPGGGLVPRGRDPKKGSLAAPVVTDMKGGELAAAKPTMTAVKDKGAAKIQLKLDRKFLADTPDSGFPIVFDPTVQLGSGNMQNYKTYPNGQVASCTSACQVRVGNPVEYWNGALTNLYWRSVGYFDYSAAMGAQVSDVWLDLARSPGEGTGAAYTNNVNVQLPNAYSWPGATGGGVLLAQGTVAENTGGQPIRGAGLTNQIAAWARDRQWGGALGFTGLEQPGLYTYKKFSIFNLNVTYAPTPPTTPASLSATAQRDGSAVLQFPSASDGGGGAVRYEVKAFTGAGQWGGTFNTTSSNPITWNGLTDGVTYWFTVQAFNAVGGGGIRTSGQVVATRYAAAPPNIKAWPGNGTAWVSWDRADPRGGPPVTGYEVFLCTPTGSVCYGPTTVTGEVGQAKINPAGITNGVTYVAVVRAVTARGVGDNGVSANLTLSATAAPFPVQFASASAGSGNRTWISWTPPQDNGTSPVTSYIIWRLVAGVYTQYWTGIPGTPTAGGTIGSFEATNLTDTRPSTYVVYPVNANGYVGAPGPGPATWEVTPAANAAPYSPQRPQGSTDPVNQPSLQAGDSQVVVRWSAPAPNGATGTCSTPNSYAVYLYDGTLPLLSQTVSGTNAIFTALPAGAGQPGIINGHTYIGVVYALNATGSCANSGYSGPAYTPYGTPMGGGDDLLNATQAVASRGDQQATVSWKKPLFGLDGITTYTIKATPRPDLANNPAPQVGQTVITTETMSGGPMLTHTIGGLRNGTSYTFTVTANLVLGLVATTPSQPSNSITPAGRPFPPVIGPATRGDQSATVTWQPPPNDTMTGVPGDNGAAITSYDVQILDSNGTEVGVRQNVASGQPISQLTNGTPYKFTVRATNAVGTGAASAPSEVVIPAGRPFAPTAATAALSGDQAATVSWLPPAAQGGVPGNNGNDIYFYRVIPSPRCPTCSGTGTSGTSTTITGLRPGTSYSFTVVARNDIGDSVPSNSTNTVATPTPAGAPNAPVFLSATTPRSGETSLTWSQPNPNGSAIIDYTVTSEPVGPTITTASNTATMTGLADGTTYRFAVVARNAIGTSPAGYSDNVTPAATPGSPAPVEAIAGDRSARLSWTPGGPGITYEITTYDAVGLVSPPPSVQLDGSSGTVSGLAGSTQYYFAVAAVNPAGQRNIAFSRTIVPYDRTQADAWMNGDLGAFLALRDAAPEPYNWTEDGCSFKIDVFWRQVFHDACKRHDFGYRNYGNGLRMGRDAATKEWIDERLRTDMHDFCDSHPQYSFSGECDARAELYYAGVHNFAGFAFYDNY